MPTIAIGPDPEPEGKYDSKEDVLEEVPKDFLIRWLHTVFDTEAVHHLLDTVETAGGELEVQRPVNTERPPMWRIKMPMSAGPVAIEAVGTAFADLASHARHCCEGCTHTIVRTVHDDDDDDDDDSEERKETQ